MNALKYQHLAYSTEICIQTHKIHRRIYFNVMSPQLFAGLKRIPHNLRRQLLTSRIVPLPLLLMVPKKLPSRPIKTAPLHLAQL